jgi:hypothetical protein
MFSLKEIIFFISHRRLHRVRHRRKEQQFIALLQVYLRTVVRDKAITMTPQIAYSTSTVIVDEGCLSLLECVFVSYIF